MVLGNRSSCALRQIRAALLAAFVSLNIGTAGGLVRPPFAAAGPLDMPKNEPFVVRATASKPIYRLLEPVVIAIEVEDAPGFRVPIEQLHDDYRMYRFFVTNKAGVESQPTQYARDMDAFDFGGKEMLSRGRVRYRAKLAANLVRDMTAPGEYTIAVAVYYGRVRFGLNRAEKPNLVKSAPVKVRVEGLPLVGE